MTPQQQLIRNLLDAPEFRDAMTAALAGRLKHLDQSLRYHARNGETLQSAHVDGQLSAYESILQLLDAFSATGNKGVQRS